MAPAWAWAAERSPAPQSSQGTLDPSKELDGEESLREGKEGVNSPALPAPPPASLLTLGGRE